MENKRIIFEVSSDMHREIKLKAFSQGLTIRQYLVNIINGKFEKDEQK